MSGGYVSVRSPAEWHSGVEHCMSIQEIPSFKTPVLCSGWLMVNRVNQSINQRRDNSALQ